PASSTPWPRVGGGGGWGYCCFSKEGGGGGVNETTENTLKSPDISTSVANITTTYNNAIPTYTTTNSGGKIAECNTTDDLKDLVLELKDDNCQITGTANLTVPQSPHEITITAKNATGTSDKTISIVISKADQSTLSITGSAKTATDLDFTFAVNGGDGTGTIIWSSDDTDIVSIVDNKLHIIKAGTVTIKAQQQTDDNYNISNQASYNLTINKANQSALEAGSNQTIITTNTTFQQTATGGSSGESITYQSSDTDIAEIDSNGKIGTIKKSGEITITSTMAGDDIYNAVSDNYTLTINKADQGTLSITGSAKTATDSDFTFATTGGDGTGALSWVSTDTNIATINTTTGLIHIIKAGTITITATKQTDDIYNISNEASYNLVISKANQAVLNAGSDVVKNATDSNFTTQTVTGGTTSGTISYASSDASVATINNSGEIDILKAGNITITATMAGDDNYNSVSDDYSLTINKVNQSTLAITGSAKTTADADFVFPTTGGDGAGTIIWQSSDTSVASIVSNQIHILKVGTTTITATKQTDDIYNASNNATYSLTITPKVADLSLTLKPTKIFEFNWSDIAGATSYKLMENKDGSSGFVEIATINPGIETYQHIVALYNRVNAKYIIQACVGATCYDSDELSVSGNLKEAIGYFKASNTGINDYFGESIAISGDGRTLAVGSDGEDSNATGINGDQTDNSAFSSGAVYIFTRTGLTWTQQAYIKASNTDAYDWFGSSVAISADGNTLAVGARGEDSNATGINGDQGDNSASYAGAVYVFTRAGITWTQQAYIKASNTDAYDYFGGSVALNDDGNTLAVGAPYTNWTNGSNHYYDIGWIYVFVRSDTSWTQQYNTRLLNPQYREHDKLGSSVTLSSDGNTLAVGAIGDDSNGSIINDSADNAGAVHVYIRSGTTWSYQAYIKASNAGTDDYFGYSVATSNDGNTLAIGAYKESHTSGAVYVFIRTDINWEQQAYIKSSNNSGYFGSSVALNADGNILAVGATGEDSNAKGINGNQSDNSASDAGAVYVFTRAGITWTQQNYIKASNTGAGDSFGLSMTLSSDGSTLAVGSDGEDSNATGINGDQTDNSASKSGAVYLY
ncbi:MAG: hypothetical protein DRQ51_09060, partial [Gammaproteobacteria bacterium]